ncbi:hypothetical protein Scep_027413 [Stephania cephalantha]|uniref:Chlororespiratory reduction 4 n=1 Tax=Stephania cephalantha TaxID=152367 RepID=A0AAP0E843_9MAGN
MSSILSRISTLLNSTKTILHLHQLHARIIQNGLEQHNLIINLFISRCTKLDAHPKHTTTHYALSIFNLVFHPNAHLWNSILKAHISSLPITISLFNRFKLSKTTPDDYTFSSLIKCCSIHNGVWEGRLIHGLVVRNGVLGFVFVGTSLVDFYGKVGEVRSARKVFDEMPERNVVSWTAMVVGYLSLGDLRSARVVFDEMPWRDCAAPAWNAMVDGYVKWGDLESARKVFDEMPERNVVSFTCLIDGYAKAGDMESARELFDRAPARDVVAWSVLISGYVQNGNANRAVEMFVEMCNENVKPDEFAMVNLMSACSQIGSSDLGLWVDSYVTRNSVDISRPHIAAALIDMNAKCGNMDRATCLFEEIPKRDLVLYCSMIQGLSIHGRALQAVRLFSRMLEEGLVPDEVALTVLLTACSRAGLVEEGMQYLCSMKNDRGLVPSPDHYACIVHLLGRAGHLEAAYDLIESMPVEPHASAWGALLGACRLHCNIKFGEMVAGKLFQLEPRNPSNYVLLSNIYANANRWTDVLELRNRMREGCVRKIPGQSRI